LGIDGGAERFFLGVRTKFRMSAGK
jgi:hypothetical protein